MHGSVLHFIDTVGPGGAETVFLQVAAGMRERGWPGRAVLVGPGWVLDSVRGRDLPVDLVQTRGRLDLRYLSRLAGLVRRHDIGLIHAHLFSPAVYASAISAWTGVPVVATFHGASDTEPGSLFRRLRHRLIQRYAVTACVSESLRQDLAFLGAKRQAGVRVIHNGVDVTAFGAADGRAMRREHGIPEDAILVGALGNLRAPKDYRTFLEAAALLAPDSRLRFAIAGERTEPLHGELVRLRDRLGLEDRVDFWGFQDDAAATLAAFDFLAISSSSEGFSLAAIQAMAAGTPVVATRSGGPERILTDGVDGLLVPPRTPPALAAAIRRLVDTPELARRLADEARRTVRDRFSLEAMLDAYEALYDGLTTDRPGPRRSPGLAVRQ